MLKLFRKIRQQLLIENKFSKYLIYAVGEIILVVIGILIALQINNWNQDQIDQTNIDASLTQILEDLQQDKKRLEFFNQLENKHVDYLNHVSDKSYNRVGLDSLLKSLDHYMFFSINTNGYSGLKDSGKFSGVHNDALKSSLTNYYEYTKELLSASSQYAETFTNNRIIPYVIENLEPDKSFGTSTQLVKDKLENSNLISLINYQVGAKNYALSALKVGLNNNTDLIALIELELLK